MKDEKQDTIPANLPRLNFPAARFRVSRSDGRQARIWDALRGCWLVLTPEEWVRRHLIAFLTEKLGVPAARISQECPVCIQGMDQRADVVVYGKDGSPLLLAECKAAKVGAGAEAMAQAVRYNTVLKARYLLVTDGIKHFIYQSDGQGGYSALDRFPDLR